MSTPFDLLEDAASDVLETTFARDFQHRPMTARPNERVTVDATRPILVVSGIFDDRHHQDAGVSSRGAPQISTPAPRVNVDVRGFTGGLPRRLDQMLRVDSGDLYEIADVQPDGQGRLWLPLRHIKREAS